MITVNVKAFGSLAQCFPDLDVGESKPIEIAPGTTLEQLAQNLNVTGAKSFFVDGISQKKTFVLQDKNEVAFMPLIAGG